MTIDEIARDRSREVRDTLAHLDRRLSDLLQQKQAAEDRLRRAAAEVNRYHDAEGDAKRQVAEADERVAEVQRKLDEIEQQRSRLIDELMELRSNRQRIETQTREAKEAGQKLEADFRQAREQSGRVEEEVRGLQEEKGRHGAALRRAFQQAFREYQERLSGVIRDALRGEEVRRQRAVEIEALKRARHEDPRVADLCDQRDQYRDLLAAPTLVPAVRDSLQGLLRNVEGQLQHIYPKALAFDEQPTAEETVADLCFFRDATGRIVITLPIDETTWLHLAEGRGEPNATAAAAGVWAVAKGLRLKPADGEFSLVGGYCAYPVELGEDETSVLAATVVPLGSGSFQLRFVRLPAEIEEAIRDEAAHD